MQYELGNFSGYEFLSLAVPCVDTSLLLKESGATHHPYQLTVIEFGPVFRAYKKISVQIRSLASRQCSLMVRQQTHNLSNNSLITSGADLIFDGGAQCQQ